MSNSWTDKRLRKEFGHREDHEYRHYNRAMGKFINSKEEFVHELKKGGYVGQNEGQRLVEEYKKRNPDKKYNGINEETRRFIADVKAGASKDGSIIPTEAMVNKMKQLGVKFEMHGDPNKLWRK